MDSLIVDPSGTLQESGGKCEKLPGLVPFTGTEVTHTLPHPFFTVKFTDGIVKFTDGILKSTGTVAKGAGS